jgi:hypothetical protein
MSTPRLRQAFMAVALVFATMAATAATAFFAAAPPAAAGGADSGTSSAYGLRVSLTGSDLLAPTPSVTLGATGGGSSLTASNVSLLGVVSAATLNAATTSTNFGAANEAIGATASATNVTALQLLGLLGTPLSIGALNTSCTSSATGSVGSTTVTSLKVFGTTVTLPSPLPPNTGLSAAQLGALSGLVTITLNAQSAQDRPGFSGTALTVDGVQVTLLTGLDAGAVINIAQSACQATGTDIEAVPTVSGLSPNVGPSAGGTVVTITGTGFVPSSTVSFNGVAATNVTYDSSTQLTATSPANNSISSNTTVPVTVTNTFGTGPASNAPANEFTYEVAPDPTNINPSAGPTTGGQSFTLTGTDFGPDSTVTFGTAPATNVDVASNGDTITGLTPAHLPGGVTATVTDAGGAAGVSYTYSTPSVSVTNMAPDVGPIAGGTTVTITGSGFTGTVAAGVLFGATPAGSTGFSVNGAGTVITVVSPAHAAGIVDVTVNNGSATSPAVAADQFTFEGTPAITPPTTGGLTPNYGPLAGGTLVTITGSGFGPDATVAFGGHQGTNVQVASGGGSLTVDAPTGDAVGGVLVSVSDAGGTSNTETYTYLGVPTINSSGGVAPGSGPTAGGTAVTITGTNFTTSGTTVVTFAGNEATNVVVVNSTQITANDPSGVAGAANVVVGDAGGSSAPGSFTYVAPPNVGVGDLSPAFGPAAGGTLVHVGQSGLTGLSQIDFGGTCSSTGDVGGTPGTSLTPISDSQATVVTPAHAAGAVPVCVTSAGGTDQAAQPFTFEAAPTIGVSGISPNEGPVAGGTPVTITGTGFAPGDPSTAVTFGGNAATDVVVVSSTQITADAPAAAGPGAVNVTVSDAGGTSNPGTFTYEVAPVISGVSPTSGPQGGGKPVTIKGTDLCNLTGVLFGGVNAPVVSVSPDCTTVTVTLPAGSGTVDVVVSTTGGSAVAPEQFTYIQPGYWMSASDGGVFAFGGAKFFGSVPGALKPGQQLNSPIVAMADTPDHGGYWLFAADGGVFCFGDAPFYGSMPGVLAPGQKLNGPVVSAEATPDGHGYRMFAADGGVFDFGDAVYEGSLPGLDVTPPAPIEGATTYPFGQGPNPNNAGYWLIAGDGSVYGFANAPYLGGARGLLRDVVTSLATTPDGEGYFVFSRSGDVAAMGDAPKGLGSPASLNAPIVFGQATSTGQGYWEFANDGGVFTYGDAPFEGSLGSLKLNQPITAGIAFGST